MLEVGDRGRSTSGGGRGKGRIFWSGGRTRVRANGSVGLVSAKVEKWGKAYLSIEEEAWWVSRVLESTGRAVDRESRDSRDRIAL